MLQEFGVFGELTPEDELVVAIGEGRDADAIAACERKADTAQAEYDRFCEQYPEFTRMRMRLARRDPRTYWRWIEWLEDPKSGPRPYGKPPAPEYELKELARLEYGWAEPERRMSLWRKAAQRASEFNVVPED